ncbi:hypothetical protein UJ11_001293 [Salmonella enterica subsp. enterica]|nr:hypothetical protein [Salmonella enterica subsp. enterica serovar Baguida]
MTLWSGCFIRMSFHQSATTKNLFCHKAGGSSFSGCQCYFPTYWLGLFRGTAVTGCPE